jgi:hypothetical protein
MSNRPSTRLKFADQIALIDGAGEVSRIAYEFVDPR